jgi:N-acetyl-alpha-D-muramate 1-phosphate uridylyltransferase
MTRPLKALILAAGRGQRMRPLTDHTPKPLLQVRGKPLIEWHLHALVRDGVREVVINTAWLEEKIVSALGDGSRFGLHITYSQEQRDHGGALETAGGIAKALPLLASKESDCFWLISGDIFVPDFCFDSQKAELFETSSQAAHLWLVANPSFHGKGDFGLDAEGFGLADSTGPDGKRWTYANLALCRASLCSHLEVGVPKPLGPMLFEAMRLRQITAQVYSGAWENVGTPEQLAALNLEKAVDR